MRQPLGLTAVVLALAGACAGPRSHIDLGPAPAGVIVEARLQYYDVTASNLMELRRAMMVLGPRWEGRSYQAVTESRFKWEYLPERKGPEVCEPSRVQVTVQTLVTFPRWNAAAAEPDSAMLEWWQQLRVGLMEHERGHARLAVRTAGDIARALEAMAPVPCDELARRVAVAGEQRITVNRRLQVEYDRTTRHGATQVEQAARLSSP